jgi:hypothetical protein
MAVVALFRTGLAGFFIGLATRRSASAADRTETHDIAEEADSARAPASHRPAE